MTNEKTIEQTFQVLSEIEHVRKRVGMYAGSPVLEAQEQYIIKNGKMEKTRITFVPALIKIISEILDNSVDEHKRNSNLNQLKVSFNGDEISVYDNGGIPVVIHKEIGKYVPEVIFGQLRSGSNYNDDEAQSLAGTNGLGSKLTCILSEHFIVETADGKKSFKQEFFNGMTERSEPIIKSSSKNYTKITFKPDYKLFGIEKLDEDHKNKIIKRLYDLSATNPNLKVYYNDSPIHIKSFKDYVSLFSDEYVYEEYDNWNIGICESSGFEQTSFVNSIETYNGGTHVDYVVYQIIASLREYFKKKHKVDIKPADIKNHLHLFISCSINRPKFSSQTKENMISAVSDFGTSVSISDKFIKKIIGSSIIQSVLDWIEAKMRADELKALREASKENSKVDPRRIDKFSDAVERKERDKCILFLCEGDSAKNSIQSGREKNPYIGSFPLKGKPLNVRDRDLSKIIQNQEITKILNIIGLKFGEQVVFENKIPKNLRFGKIAFATDQDLDGFHISGLLINLFHRFWPELLKNNVVYLFRTPLVKVTLKQKNSPVLEFFSEKEFENWRNTNSDLKGWVAKYYKGLGTSSSKEFKTYFQNLDSYLYNIKMEDRSDEDCIDLAFNNSRADDRKNWLSTPADNFEDFIE